MKVHWPAVLLGLALSLAPSSLTRLGAQQSNTHTFTASGGSLPAAQAEVDAMLRDGRLDIDHIHADTMIGGRAHERLGQRYLGVRVFGGELVRQLDGGVPISIFGRIYADIGVDPTPTLSPDDAKRAIQRLVGVVPGPDVAPELYVLPQDDGTYVLTYRLRITTATDRLVYFVDARRGGIVRQYSDLQRQAAIGTGTGVFGDKKKVSSRAESGVFLADDRLRAPSGVAAPQEIATFDLRGNATRTLGFLEGTIGLGTSDLASSATNTWTDGPDVDGHVYAGYTYDYYYKRFGRRGLDDHNLHVFVLIHPASRSDITTAPNDVVNLLYLNAFYAGDGVVVYGEGLPAGFVIQPFNQTVNYFSAGLDIVAHELTHGVTEFSSGLIYMNESGALNEALSDIMAVSVKFFYRPAGSGLMQANYELGSDVIRPGGIRSLDNPGIFGDPDHYVNRVTGTDDNGGVHTNCTIVDHAFYLAIEGGVNRTSGLSVQGVGAQNREQIEKIFYRGLTLLLTPNATFSLARAATIQAARDLYGPGTAPERAIIQAWTAVGVE